MPATTTETITPALDGLLDRLTFRGDGILDDVDAARRELELLKRPRIVETWTEEDGILRYRASLALGGQVVSTEGAVPFGLKSLVPEDLAVIKRNIAHGCRRQLANAVLDVIEPMVARAD